MYRLSRITEVVCLMTIIYQPKHQIITSLATKIRFSPETASHNPRIMYITLFLIESCYTSRLLMSTLLLGLSGYNSLEIFFGYTVPFNVIQH